MTLVSSYSVDSQRPSKSPNAPKSPALFDAELAEYAKIFARGAVKDMVPGPDPKRPFLYWSNFPPENCATMLLERTPGRLSPPFKTATLVFGKL